MPRLAESVYASYFDNVLKLAAKKGGASRQDLMDGLNISRAVADSMVERCKLVLDHKDGRTEYFKIDDGSVPAAVPEVAAPVIVPVQAFPAAVKAAAVVTEAPAPVAVKAKTAPAEAPVEDTGTEEDKIASLDATIIDTRNALKEAATKAGKALADWAINEAMVDTLRERLQKLALARIEAQ